MENKIKNFSTLGISRTDSRADLSSDDPALKRVYLDIIFQISLLDTFLINIYNIY